MAAKELDYSKILISHNLRNTQFRRMVIQHFYDNKEKALSHADLEELIPDCDRVTLYRTLKSFEVKGLIHLALDSSNQPKYALCHENCDPKKHSDDHAHFHCKNCNQTHCLDDQKLIKPNIPSGYQLHNMHYIMEGICDQCSNE